MGKTLADLQSDISISAEHAVSGTLNWVDDYTGFSSNPAEQSGNYIALKIDTEASDEPLEGATITATYHGRDVVLDSDQIIIVRHAEGEDTITFTATKEGYTTGVMTLDLSNLILTPEPAKFSLTCNTPAITFAPNGTMAGGVATFEITATGQVPYDTTTSSNLINMTLTTNASPNYDQTNDSILIAYVDSEETTHTLYTGSLTWSDDVGTATFNCPITADSITYSPVIAIVVDGTNATRVSQVLDTSALTLQEAPYNPETDPFFELTGVVYNDHTYDVSDFVSGGTLTRGYNGSQNNLVLTGAIIKYCGIDPSADENYYLAFTSRVGAEVEHEGSYYEFTELSLNDSLNNPPSPHTLPQTFLVKVNRNTSSISGSGKFKPNSHTTSNKSPKIYLQNCTWETDPRPSFSNVYFQNVADGEYNGTPLSTYFSVDNSRVSQSTNTFNNVNGYYGFMNIVSLSSQPPAENITVDFKGQVDATKLPDGEVISSAGIWNGVYKYDASNCAGTDQYRLTAPGYKPYSLFGLNTSKFLVSNTYSNGLNVRNIGIKPLSTDVKNDGFGDHCDLTFTPIDPATATVINNEVNVSVSGTIKKKSTAQSAGSHLTDYKPLYKNWTNSYSAIDKKDASLSLEKDTYFFIFEVDCGFRDLVGSQMWQCKGFTSTQTTFTMLAHPSVLSTSKKTVWAIPIEEGTTSVSIKCVPPSSNCFTEVIYNFDLTNVIYGTIS